MKVRNIKGTSFTKCRCGSWLQHWENYNVRRARLPVYCAGYNCNKVATEGAHVKIRNDNRWFIIPVCHEHNMRTDEYYIYTDTPLALANKYYTCGS